MLVGSVKNVSLFQTFTLNLIGFGVCDLGEPNLFPWLKRDIHESRLDR